MARRLARFFHLSFSDQWLLMRAALAVVSAKLAIRTLRLPTARAAVTRLEHVGDNYDRPERRRASTVLSGRSRLRAGRYPE